MRLNPWYLLLALLTVGLGFMLSQMLERYEEPVDQGWSAAALRNPFLAAEHFLSSHNLAVRSSDSLQVLDDLSVDSTLIIRNANHVLSDKRADELVAWMEAGGHVIVAAQYFDEEQSDVLLSRFDISKHPRDYSLNSDGEEEPEAQEKALRELLEEANAQLQEEAAQRADEEAAEQLDVAGRLRQQEARVTPGNLIYLSFEQMDYRAVASFDHLGDLSHPAFYLEEDEAYEGYRPFYWAGNESAIGFMQMEVGDGLLTVLSDVDIWTSRQIGLFDHAFLLQMLTAGAEEVVLLYGAVVPNLFELIGLYFPELTWTLLLLLAAWLFYRWQRFGPVLEFDSSTRRSFAEHIQAVGNFLWRQGMQEELYESARAEVWRCLYQRYPGSERLSSADNLNKLAQASGTDLQQLQVLMSGRAPSDEIHFYHSIKKLQGIRNSL